MKDKKIKGLVRVGRKANRQNDMNYIYVLVRKVLVVLNICLVVRVDLEPGVL